MYKRNVKNGLRGAEGDLQVKTITQNKFRKKVKDSFRSRLNAAWLITLS